MRTHCQRDHVTMDNGTPLLTYEVHGSNGDYTEEWYCQPPPAGIVYLVTDCRWSPDFSTRRIFAVSTGQGRERR